MKKKVIFASILALSLSLCACSSNKTGNVDELTNTGTDLLELNGIDDFEDYDEGYDEIVHDEPFYPSSFDGFTYESTLVKLGNYEGLRYALPETYTASEEEIEEEVASLLSTYEMTEKNDEAAQYIGYENLKDMYEQIRFDIESGINSENYASAATDLFNALMASSEFNILDSDIESVYKEQVASYEEMATFFGVTFEELVNDYFEMTLEDLEKEVKNDAVTSIKTTLLVNGVVKEAGIDMKSVWDEKCAELLAEYGYDDAWEFVDLYEDERYLISEVKYKLVADFLMEKGVNSLK